ncbi:hypothetical protein CR513_35111, partial [Mucuna pruriens]
MASVQCHKTCEESCQQKSQHGSFGQKVSEFFKGHHNHSTEGTITHTQCSSQTKVLSHSGHFTTKTQTQCNCTQTQNTHSNTIAHRPRREHKRGLVQKIKDRLSDHSTDDSSSDSDNENCHKRKASERLKLRSCGNNNWSSRIGNRNCEANMCGVIAVQHIKINKIP